MSTINRLEKRLEKSNIPFEKFNSGISYPNKNHPIYSVVSEYRGEEYSDDLLEYMHHGFHDGDMDPVRSADVDEIFNIIQNDYKRNN